MHALNANQKLEFKQKLLDISLRILDERIAVCQIAIDNAQASANEEEKSSAGDKYETSRAMSHIEKDMYAKQLAANKSEKAALLGIDCTKLYSTIGAGSVIQCNELVFFLAAGIGKIIHDNKTVYFISPNAPLAITLIGKKVNDKFTFNKTQLIIGDIF